MRFDLFKEIDILNINKFNLIIYIIILFIPLKLFSQSVKYIDYRMDKINKLISNGDCKSALKDLKLYVKQETEHEPAFLKIGYCSIETKQYENAIKAFTRAEEISSGIEPWLGLQLVYLAKGDYENSIAAGNSVITIDTFNYLAKLRIAEAYIKLERFSRAESEIKEVTSIHGKSADILWNIGRIRYLQGDTEEAYQQFESAYDLNPDHKGTRFSLGLPVNKFSLEVSPIYAHYHFSHNSIKSGGDRRGGYANLILFDKWSIGGGHTLDTVGNLSESGGNFKYITSSTNVYNYALYGYNTPELIQTYYNLPINQYYTYNNILSADFRVHQSSGHISYTPNFYSKYKISHHKLESNEVYTDGSAITEFSFITGREMQFGVAGSRILFPKHNGYQGTFTFKFKLFDSFLFETNLIGETVNIQNYKVEFLSFSSYYYVNTYQEYDRSNLGAAQQSITYSNQYMTIGCGGRAGELYTPILGDMPIINPSLLRSGAFGFISIHPNPGFIITLSNSRDYWKNAYGETPHSDQTKITGTIRF